MNVVPHTLSVQRIVAATPQTLYSAWTEPDQMRRWYATVVDADVRVGGHYRIEMHEDDGVINAFTGVYLELEPPTRVAFTFTHHSQTPEHRISDEIVTVEFREIEPGRTEVTLTNSWTGPECEPSDYDAARHGWDELLNRLEKAGLPARRAEPATPAPAPDRGGR